MSPPTATTPASPADRSPSTSAGSRRALERLLGIAATEGNRVSVLRNGQEIFPAMLADIDAAEETIDLCTFVYWTGDVAVAMAESLAERARAGVRVRVLIDAVGGRDMRPQLVQRMTDSGADVRWFRPPTRNPLKIEHRTHRKVLVCDGRIGYTGGVGIAQEWQGDGRSPGCWRDTHVRFDGPAVLGLHAGFLRNWVESHPATLHELIEDGVAPRVHDDGIPVQVVTGHGSIHDSDVGLALRALVSSAERTLNLTTAYFNPADELAEVIHEAAARGVTVRLLVPGEHIDKRIAAAARDHELGPALEAGVRVWRYRPSMLHAKILTVDGQVAAVGSANVNARSSSRDDELMAIVHAPEIAELLDEHLDADMAHADELLLEDWRRRGLVSRVAETLVAPIRRYL
ncbi:MAG TPA: phospholipase D-like domain-containing protein [Acidimicrobiales bacterium]|nr:phospholipase D-like domain-containing protein [Acidimicrobiales bacterium]